jgi:hypothetical protein
MALSFLEAELKAYPVTCLRREVDGRSDDDLSVDIA